MARPNLSYLKNVTLTLCGVPAGLLTGLTAAANSILLIPSIIWLVGLRLNRAAATALAVTTFAALSALIRYGLNGDIQLWLAIVLVIGQAVGAACGTRLILAQPRLLRFRVLWGVLIVVLGLGMAAQGRGLVRWEPWLAPIHGVHFWLLTCVAAVGVGLAGLIMEAAGVLLVPAVVEILRVPPHVAQGTALLVLLLTALPALMIYGRRGDLEPQATVWLSVGGVLGGLLGAYWVSTIRADTLLLMIYGFTLAAIGLTHMLRRDVDGAA